MKLKKFFSIFLATIMIITAIPLSAYADDIPTDNEESCEIIWYNDDGSIVAPIINKNGTFTYYFSDRLHSSTFTATSNKISLSFITSTNTKAYYYIALYDMTDDSLYPTFKSMTQSKDNKTADSKTFNVKKGREYRLTFSKVNPKNNDWIRGKGTLYGAKA